MNTSILEERNPAVSKQKPSPKSLTIAFQYKLYIFIIIKLS